MKVGYIYFMTNRKGGVIYIGVTSDLIRRVWEHQQGLVAGFTKRYNAKLLVHYEILDDIETAILYEKKLKNVSRAKKIAIIERNNPEWQDLYPTLTA
jgi:putative endonuclease